MAYEVLQYDNTGSDYSQVPNGVTDDVLSQNANGSKSWKSSALVNTNAVFAVSTTTAALGLKHQYSCTDTSAPRALTVSSADIALGSPTDHWVFDVKDQSGGANTNNITINTEGAETIDGVAAVLITDDYGSVMLYSDGTNLYTL
jgi:hypothetical protein